jgi:hypothetical protein
MPPLLCVWFICFFFSANHDLPTVSLKPTDQTSVFFEITSSNDQPHWIHLLSKNRETARLSTVSLFRFLNSPFAYVACAGLDGMSPKITSSSADSGIETPFLLDGKYEPSLE